MNSNTKSRKNFDRSDSKSNPKSNFKSKPKFKQERVVDLSKQDSFLFNKTPILASALMKLKKNQGNKNKGKPKGDGTIMPNSNNKGKNESGQVDMDDKEDLSIGKPMKKVKKTQQSMLPNFAYTPLQKDLYNFYTINKVSLKAMDWVPEPKFQVGSLVLAALSDRGVGGKYLVVNLFRNKKGYIDYREVSQQFNRKDDFTGIQSYQEPGDYVLCTVVKSINQNHLQLSMSKFIQQDAKGLRVGQVLPAEIKSKQELGCHLTVAGFSSYKFFLPKSSIQQSHFASLNQHTQIICTISEIDHQKLLIKVQLTSQQLNGLNLRGIQQEQMSKIQLQQYVVPGTLVNTKVIKVLKNGLMVKFLKIFVGFIHVDHLDLDLQAYANDNKLECRIIYSCLSPPLLYLSQKHTCLQKYSPNRPLYTPVNKPQSLNLLQGSYFNKQEQFFVHPTQLHSEIDNINKFWVKENNYFQRYQIMGSKKLGLRVGQVAKQIPFSNFRIYADGKQPKEVKQSSSKFRVLCIDVWNKVIKISYDDKFIKASNMLLNVQEIDVKKLYCGIIKNINENGITVQFCNNIRGIIPKNQIKMQQLDMNESNIGKSMQVYISQIKARKNFLTLSLIPPQMRTKRVQSSPHSNPQSGQLPNLSQLQQSKNQQSTMGTISSIDPHSIHPIYIKLKSNKFVKISIFTGIRPASVSALKVVTDILGNFKVGQNIRVFRKGKQYFLYPPEQLSDKNLRICRIVGQKGSILRVQTGKSQFRNCHICDITDLIVPYPFSQVAIGQYKIGRVLANGMMCLRDSIIINGIPKSMSEHKEKYSSDEARGDYRNRLLIVGSGGLKEDMVMFGYVKVFTQKGCFVSISNDFEVRIQMCQLTDEYMPDKAKFYPTNKLILCRLISEKVKPNDPSKHLFDASARQSIVKMGYPINQQSLMVGLTVEGKVTGYTKGKALIRLAGSKLTGIMNPSQVSNIDSTLPIQKSMPLGTLYKMKIIELSNVGRQLIRLSTLSKYFTKYKGVELGKMQDQNAVKLYENYQQMMKEEPKNIKGAITSMVEQNNHDEDVEDQEDEYQRIKGMIGRQLNQEDNEEEQEQGDGQEEQDDQNLGEQLKSISRNKNQERLQQQSQSQSHSINKKSNELLQVPLSSSELSQKLAQFVPMSTTPLVSQSVLLANDSSQSHLQYIASMISSHSVTAQQIRNQFMKSISLLHEIKEKQNMWIAWLNMELIIGDFVGVATKAIHSDVGLPVYFRIIDILRQKDNWDLAYQIGRKMMKKFRQDIKTWIFMIKFVTLQQIQGRKQSTSVNQLIRRASQSLPSSEIPTLQSHHAKFLFQQSLPQQARTVFSTLLSTQKALKRTDLWTMFIDLEIKFGTIQKARQIMQRCLTIGLKKKKIVTMLKKYYKMELEHGDETKAKQVLQRAKAIAEQMEDNKEGSQDEK